MSEKQRKEKLQEFVSWFKKHIKGYEKGEGQLFFNKLLQAFGNQGVLEVGATCEERVKKRKGTTGFADFVWKPRAVIELKERGANLSKHYEQAFEYWWTLVPNRPQYMILCNFDEFWIYDLNIQINDPVHKLRTDNLASDWGGLAFLFPRSETPVFNNNNVEVTEEAAKIVGSMFFSMAKRKVEPIKAQKFVLQTVVALFSEDVGLIPKYTIHKILGDAVKNPITQKEMSDLFLAMATENVSKKAKKYKDIPFFNGGIFHDVEAVELNYKELDLLYEASKQDWSKVRPSIFGSIFEASMDPEKRDNLAAHYTSELDIQKIVFPSIIKPFRQKIESAKSKKDYAGILKEIREFKILDPACGSGNFLYIAFRELRKIEVEILDVISELEKSKQIKMSMVSPKNFYGIDINSFGLELAKVALCIGRKISADEFGVNDNILPFDNLDDNFLNKDALFTKWPLVDAVIGNPPFHGKRNIAEKLTDEYVKSVRDHFKNVPKNIDYCAYWFRIAQDHPAKFVGLVGTNSIAQGYSRQASLDYIVENGGVLHYCVSTQDWSGDAAVHVSIANWHKTKLNFEKILDGHIVDNISSSLKSDFNVAKAKRLTQNKSLSFQGCNMNGEGFILKEAEAQKLISLDTKNKRILRPMFDGTGIVDKLIPDEWVIDFAGLKIEQASEYKVPFDILKTKVKPFRAKKKDKAVREKWWLFERPRVELRKAVKNLNHYFAISQVSKYTIFRKIDVNILPCEATMVVASEDNYILGVLNSKLHRDWVKAQASTLKGDTRYTNTTCFETFPFIWNAKSEVVARIERIAFEIEEFKNTECSTRKISFTELYNQFFNEPTSELSRLHEQLNRSCCELYGWSYDPSKNYNAELFALNADMYKKEASEVNVLKSNKKKIDIKIGTRKSKKK